MAKTTAQPRGSSSKTKDPALERLGFWRRQWRDNIKPIGTAVIAALLIRQFVVQAFRIPTGSMEQTLLVGDFLFVNKFLYGAKTPDRLRIPFVNKTLVEGLPVLKLPDIREPQQGDIIVFEYPLDRDQDYIKRCVGVAGDQIEMLDGLVYVNGQEYEDDLVHPDRDTSKTQDGERQIPHTNHDARKAGQQLNRSYGLAEALSIRAMTPELFLMSVKAAVEADVGLDPTILAPHIEALRGSVNGTTPLTMTELRPHLLQIRDHSLVVDAPYVVPEGYLFMMGDNRYNSADSRFWGPLDKELVRGKALFIYWSWDKERTLPRFSRLLDLIR
jgi:signal peptidase I